MSRYGNDGPCTLAEAQEDDEDRVTSPNSVDVDETGCSCKMPPFHTWQRNPIDPACPKHGEPLQHGDGDVDVHHPDGSVTVIPEPAPRIPTVGIEERVIGPQPRPWDADIPPAMLAEERAAVAELEDGRDGRTTAEWIADLVTARQVAEAEAEQLRAKVARVEALADEWTSHDLGGSPGAVLRLCGIDLREALADPAPVDQQDECVRVGPEVGHEDEGHSCVTHNGPWGECR